MQGVVQGASRGATRMQGLSKSVMSISTEGFHVSEQQLLTAGSMPSEAEPRHMAANRSVAACLWGNCDVAVSGLARMAAEVCCLLVARVCMNVSSPL